jgi:glycine oxidase
MQHADIAIAGAGIIGLSLALELHRRGVNVVVIDAERDGIASRAAAGMLAANDPENPVPLHAISQRSLALYPDFLAEVEYRSGITVPLQTKLTLQYAEATESGAFRAQEMLPDVASNIFVRKLEERSLDPRVLYAALHQAVESAEIRFERDTIEEIREDANSVTLRGVKEVFTAERSVDCTGAWSHSLPNAIRPSKGQMLRIQLNGELTSAENDNVVLRTPEIYIVPRLDGTALVGATVEDAGFDLTARAEDERWLRARAADLVPAAAGAPLLEHWAGVRPATSDRLPLLGALSQRRFLATGHFRNGILLAPGTAVAMADLLQGKEMPDDIAAFAPGRFESGL